MRIYLVGGAVRDQLLGRPVTDKDYVVLHASREELLARLPRLKQVGGGPATSADGVFLDRSDQYTISQAASIEEDLATRDLTVNALAVDLERPERVIAHPLALHDLEQRLLRPVAVANFGHDPCRTVRAARFAAVLPGFAPALELFAAMRHGQSQGLGKVAGERIAQETRKALAGLAPARFLAFLGRAGCLNPWFAPFAGRPWLQRQAEQLMQRLATQDSLRGYMALCHHLPPQQALRMGERLRLPNRWQQAGADAALLLPSLRDYDSLSPEKKVRLLLHCHKKRLLSDLQALALARYGTQAASAWQGMARDLERILEVRLPEGRRNRGPASGRELMRLRKRVLASD